MGSYGPNMLCYFAVLLGYGKHASCLGASRRPGVPIGHPSTVLVVLKYTPVTPSHVCAIAPL